MTERTDQEIELVARAQSGVRPAFERLVELHADRLFAVVMRVTGAR